MLFQGSAAVVLPQTPRHFADWIIAVKRSEINAIMQKADDFIQSHGFYLPPFAYWTPDDWTKKGPEVSEIVENNLGWDITDFGQGDFHRIGLFLFTIRNGNIQNWQTLKGKLYAEKIMIVEDGQVTPMHFHWKKMEDIINRGGGELLIQLYNATADEQLDEKTEVHVSVDGLQRTLEPGDTVRLVSGESISLEPRCYHKFWGQGRVLIGEVSLVNDDQHDNRFYEPFGRFPEINEDVPPLYLLCNDYARYYKGK
jgi:D-lyxose ketol-isomerase